MSSGCRPAKALYRTFRGFRGSRTWRGSAILMPTRLPGGQFAVASRI